MTNSSLPLWYPRGQLTLKMHRSPPGNSKKKRCWSESKKRRAHSPGNTFRAFNLNQPVHSVRLVQSSLFTVLLYITPPPTSSYQYSWHHIITIGRDVKVLNCSRPLRTGSTPAFFNPLVRAALHSRSPIGSTVSPATFSCFRQSRSPHHHRPRAGSLKPQA